jgi:hypothetical protein
MNRFALSIKLVARRYVLDRSALCLTALRQAMLPAPLCVGSRYHGAGRVSMCCAAACSPPMLPIALRCCRRAFTSMTFELLKCRFDFSGSISTLENTATFR